MANQSWKWAKLSDEQLSQLREGEQTLDVEYLLAYEPSQSAAIQPGRFSQDGLQVAELDQSQLECLQGLEKNIRSVLVAYK